MGVMSEVRVPEGWVLVPREPTREMVKALMRGMSVPYYLNVEEPVHKNYAAMLAAAPAPGPDGRVARLEAENARLRKELGVVGGLAMIGLANLAVDRARAALAEDRT